jgi:hypothetical protein
MFNERPWTSIHSSKSLSGAAGQGRVGAATAHGSSARPPRIALVAGCFAPPAGTPRIPILAVIRDRDARAGCAHIQEFQGILAVMCGQNHA